MKYTGEALSEFKSKLRRFCSKQETIFWLESNNLNKMDHIDQYELLVALGSEERLEITDISNDLSDKLDEFWSGKSWKFFALSYDLKNQLHKLESSSHDELKWPLLYAIKPQVVISITHDGALEIHGKNKEQVLFDINNSTSHIEEDFRLSFSQSIDSMTQSKHHEKVLEIKRHIAEGDMYEMNLCMETVLKDFHCNNTFELFHRLSKQSPTPFGSFVRVGNKSVACASPERYLSKRGNRIYSQPIKGTSKCYNDDHLDYQSKLHLANSIKERAEHVMIVDLVRNDLSQICLPGSVRVEELFGIYKFKQVFQMISTVVGELEADLAFSDFLKATYPMGSMTGAPKHIVMKFIDSIETTSRGWYSGTIGYQAPNGDFDSNVVIRSILCDSSKRVAKYSVGGAITFDSDPTMEYDECMLKSKAIRDLLST